MKLKHLFCAAVLTASNLVLATFGDKPQETEKISQESNKRYASSIAKILFLPQYQESNAELLEKNLQEKALLRSFKEYDVELPGECLKGDLEAACDYLDDSAEELILFKQQIMADYLLKAQPKILAYISSELVLEVTQEIRNQSSSLEPVNEQELMRPRELIQEGGQSNLSSLERIEADFSQLNSETLESISKNFDGKDRDAKRVAHNINKIFWFLGQNPALSNLANSVLPADSVSRFINATESHVQPSSTVFSGQSISLNSEEGSIQNPSKTERKEDAESEGAPRKFLKKDNEDK